MPIVPKKFYRCKNRAPLDPDNEIETVSPAPKKKQNFDFFYRHWA